LEELLNSLHLSILLSSASGTLHGSLPLWDDGQQKGRGLGLVLLVPGLSEPLPSCRVVILSLSGGGLVSLGLTKVQLEFICFICVPKLTKSPLITFHIWGMGPRKNLNFPPG